MCPLCSGSSYSDFPIHYVFQDKRFGARQCSSCGFVYVFPRPTDQELGIMYSDEYFLHDGGDFGAHASTDYETAAQRGSAKFPLILSQIRRFKREGRFFEVGCGMGYFLDYVRRNGFEVSGIEYAALGTQACRTKFGLEVTQSSFEAYEPSGHEFEVVFMGDVLEHLIDPLAMLRKAHSMIAPGGIVAVELPVQFNCFSGQIGSTLLRILGRNKRMPMPPYHVNEFLPSTITTMLKCAGFSQVRIFQRIKRPSSITLRGSFPERLFKLSLQYPNYIFTSITGKLGDRLLAIGIR